MKYQIDNSRQEIKTGDMTSTERILQNCKNLLMTGAGEVPYMRSIGFDRRLFDLPFTQFKAKLIKELDRMLMYEPNAELVTAECKMLDDETIHIVMTVEVEE